MTAIRDYLCEQDEQFLLLDPESFDSAILGVIEGAGGKTTVCYCRKKVIELLMEADGMDREDAEEYFSFNILGAFFGEGTPVFLTRTEELTLQ